MAVKKDVPSSEFQVLSKKKVLNQGLLAIFVTLIVAGCGGNKTGTLMRVALLAPFEGRYREVGYNAYYAAKLALQDHDKQDIELVAVDDGGTVGSAVDRAQALAGDPPVKAVIALGYAATNEATQTAFRDLPVVVVGYWGAKPTVRNIFILNNRTLADIITLPDSAREITAAAQMDTPITGGDVLALKQFPLLNQNTETVTVISSGNLPDASFAARYLESATFTPQPGLLATLTYDATRLILDAITNAGNGNIGAALADIEYKGLNGNIRFQDGYWVDAPMHYFRYDAIGNLVPVDGLIE